MEVFQNMWFVPIRERGRTQADTELLLTRARNITDVVTISSAVFFSLLLTNKSVIAMVLGKPFQPGLILGSSFRTCTSRVLGLKGLPSAIRNKSKPS
jgi:hypothetical protein